MVFRLQILFFGRYSAFTVHCFNCCLKDSLPHKSTPPPFPIRKTGVPTGKGPPNSKKGIIFCSLEFIIILVCVFCVFLCCCCCCVFLSLLQTTTNCTILSLPLLWYMKRRGGRSDGHTYNNKTQIHTRRCLNVQAILFTSPS